MKIEEKSEMAKKENIDQETVLAASLLNAIKSPEVNDNSLLFWGFVHAYGFNSNNYSNNLELIQSVPNSISQYIKKDNQFLLSRNVKYEALQAHGIEGACGYIDKYYGIVVPRSVEADEYFRTPQMILPNTQIPRYIYPTIKDFDSLISYCDLTSKTYLKQLRQIIESIYFPFTDRYIGFIINRDDEKSLEKVGLISDILTAINKRWCQQQYKLIHDTVSNESKELYLIKKK